MRNTGRDLSESDMPDSEDVVAAADPAAAFLEAHARGEAVRLATSGTTGASRAVVRTTASWVDSFPAVSDLADLDRSAKVWIPGPLAATMNLFAAVHARWAGAAVVHRPLPQHAAEAPPGITHVHLTPAQLRTALQRDLRLAGVHAVVAGDRLPVDLAERARAAGMRTSHYYGAAELSFVAWGTHDEDLRLFPGVEVDVRDGVLWARSPYLACGYVGAAGPLRVADDGFATVGDRGSLVDGVLTVAGRGAGTVVTGGVTVLVADVEQALRRAGGVDVVVVGVPHPRLGQLVAAVLRDPAEAGPARAAARTALAPAHRPRRWLVAAEPPLTASGKVDRTALAELAASGRLPTAQPPNRVGTGA